MNASAATADLKQLLHGVSLEASYSRAKIHRMALEFASAGATRLACEVEGEGLIPAHIRRVGSHEVRFGGRARPSRPHVLLGTGALLPGACPRSEEYRDRHRLKRRSLDGACPGSDGDRHHARTRGRVSVPTRGSTRPSRTPTLTLPHSMGEEWEGEATNRHE
jgi:hypothetical protein